MKLKLLEHNIGEKYLFIDGAEIHLGKCVSAYLVWSGNGNEAEIMYGFNTYNDNGEFSSYFEEIKQEHISKSLKKLEKKLKNGT